MADGTNVYSNEYVYIERIDHISFTIYKMRLQPQDGIGVGQVVDTIQEGDLRELYHESLEEWMFGQIEDLSQQMSDEQEIVEGAQAEVDRLKAKIAQIRKGACHPSRVAFPQ